MSFRCSIRTDLSLMSLLCSHVLIWSRCLCSFLIDVLRSASALSLDVWFEALFILSKVSSKLATPCWTSLRTRSMSACARKPPSASRSRAKTLRRT